MFRKRMMSRTKAENNTLDTKYELTLDDKVQLRAAANNLKSAIFNVNPSLMKDIQNDYLFKNEMVYVLSLLKWNGVDNWNQPAPQIAREMLENN